MASRFQRHDLVRGVDNDKCATNSRDICIFLKQETAERDQVNWSSRQQTTSERVLQTGKTLKSAAAHHYRRKGDAIAFNEDVERYAIYEKAAEELSLREYVGVFTLGNSSLH